MLAGGLLNDDVSLAAAGYAEQQFLFLVVSKPPAAAAAPAPVAVAAVQPRVVSSQQHQPVRRRAAAVTATAVVKCGSGHSCCTHTYQNTHRKCAVCNATIENQSIGARCSACNFDVCHECAFKIHTPAINFATEWLDEDGRVCPKNVDYATQCPKGHALLPLVTGDGSAQAQQSVMCRVCHSFTDRERASQWLMCGVMGCCGGYLVCGGCFSALRDAPAAGVAGDDFPILVSSSTCSLSHV